MPRQLLRDGAVVADDWTYLAEACIDAAQRLTTADAAPAVILTCDEWLADELHWVAAPGRLGVVLAPAQSVDLLVPNLGRLELIAADFPGPSEGRGYTQGRLLRERHGFRGELRAVGYVRRDQLFFLARCGFNSFELPEADLAQAAGALATFSAEYQPSNDAGLRVKLRHRSA